MDDMAIIDDVAMLAIGARPPAPQGDDVRGALETVEPVVIKTHAQTVSDQPRGKPRLPSMFGSRLATP